MIQKLGSSERKQAVYYVFIYGMSRIFPADLTMIRAISAIAGVMSVLAIFFLARLLFDSATGLFAATLLSVSRYHIYLSTLGRVYAIVVLLSICSTYLLILTARNLEARWRIAPLYIACAALLMYAHYFGIILVAMQLATILALACYHGAPRLAALGAAAAVSLTALYLPLASNLVADMSETPGLSWISRPRSASEIVILFAIYLQGVVTTTVGGGFTIILLCVWAVRDVRLITHKIMAYTLLAWIVLPISFTYCYSLIGTPIWVPRYTAICLPPIFILIAVALRRLIRSDRIVPASLALIAWQFTSLFFEKGGLWGFRVMQWELVR